MRAAVECAQDLCALLGTSTASDIHIYEILTRLLRSCVSDIGSTSHYILPRTSIY